MKDLAEKRLALGRYRGGATKEVADVEVRFEGSVGADGMCPREMATAHVDKDDAFRDRDVWSDRRFFSVFRKHHT